MGETRVNLKHLLEDIRDSYPYPIEESIIMELIANSLDAGASQIKFLTDFNGSLTLIDNGKGMNEKEFEKFHDIAATTKVRGKGIGFAGVGVKLALLISERVITETNRGMFHKATSWKLEDQYRAPWKYVEPKSMIKSVSGTAVTITPSKENLASFDPLFIEHVIQTHFYPILHREFMDKILKYVYKKGMKFYINEKETQLQEIENNVQSKFFLIQLGRRGKPVGIGFLSKSKIELTEEERGIAISTYGKIIKRGWDWIGIIPRNPIRLTGIAEVPQLSEILTTNKADFLKDTNSLQKYYRYRKAIQEAIEPILRELGEVNLPKERIDKDFRPIEREIEKVLENMLEEFPELSPLLGRRLKGEPVKGIIPDADAAPIGKIVEGVEVMTGTKGGRGEGKGIEATEGEFAGERIEKNPNPTERGREYKGKRRRPGLMIGFEDDPRRYDLGWLMENTVWINKAHPAYQRAMDSGAENYHIVLAVAWVLSNHLEGKKSPQEFLNRFLSNWGKRT